jgi:hypothetical protein
VERLYQTSAERELDDEEHLVVRRALADSESIGKEWNGMRGK